MPEGDTIYRTAVALRTALLGKKMVDFEAPRLTGLKPQIGQTIEEVRSRGKHLEIIWDDGVVLHTHMRMTGSWHLYRIGERWRKPEHRARVVLAVEDWVAVCFSAPVVETYRDFDPRRHPILGRLGPDLCRVDADLEECVDRMMNYEEPDMTVAEVLLDQRVMCGVGNVYRCEILWSCEISPWAPIASLKRAECREIVQLAAELLQANLHHAQRVTAPEIPGGLAVYGRQGKSCHRCHDTIKVTHHGEAHRVLYWCPGCQTMHEPMMRPNFTPLYIERDATRGDTHPAAVQFSVDDEDRRVSGY